MLFSIHQFSFDVTVVPSNTSIHENTLLLKRTPWNLSLLNNRPELVIQWPGFVCFGGIQTPCQVAATFTRRVKKDQRGVECISL